MKKQMDEMQAALSNAMRVVLELQTAFTKLSFAVASELASLEDGEVHPLKQAGGKRSRDGMHIDHHHDDGDDADNNVVVVNVPEATEPLKPKPSNRDYEFVRGGYCIYATLPKRSNDRKWTNADVKAVFSAYDIENVHIWPVRSPTVRLFARFTVKTVAIADEIVDAHAHYFQEHGVVCDYCNPPRDE